MPGLARGEAPPDVHGSWQNRRQRGVSSRSLLWPNSDAALAAFHWRADERPLTLAHPRVSKQVKIKRLNCSPRSAFTHRAAPYDAGPGCSVTTELVYGSAWPNSTALRIVNTRSLHWRSRWATWNAQVLSRLIGR